MKTTIIILGLVLTLGLSGCSTPRSVANLRGQGTKQVFAAPFDSVWRATVDAAQQGELEILTADRDAGYIGARRGVQVETFGENVGVWVTRLTPNQTEVEVVSRQRGPPVLWLKNWENEVLRTVAANLTREPISAVGAAGVPTGVIRSEDHTYRTDFRFEEERRRDELRQATALREQELQREENERRREELRAEIERLRDELRRVEDRLFELEAQDQRLR